MRQAGKKQLEAASRELRAQTLACLAHIDPSRERLARRDIVNLPVWELGHVGWVQEHWCLRYQAGRNLKASLLPNADAMLDSAAIAHPTRWSLALPSMAQTRQYLSEVFELAQQALARCDDTDESLYFHRLCYFHEAMHLEAFCYTWQTVAYPMPDMLGAPPALSSPSELNLPAGEVEVGSRPGRGFVFDNEKWAQTEVLDAFAIDAQPVSYGLFARFVDEGGYRDPHWWDAQAWEAMRQQSIELPQYWRRNADSYQVRRFDQWIALPVDQPVMHVSAHEARAYCRWAGRSLPSEAQWTYAAVTEPAFSWGDSVWEWTASTFNPLPGFSADPYKEYSQPWFGDHRVVRGGSFATPRHLVDTRFRNFYLPQRNDPFLGFRTCRAL